MNSYNQNDIKEMLKKELKVDWNGLVYDGADKVPYEDSKDIHSLVVEKDFNGHSLEMTFDVDVSDFRFRVYQDEPEILGSGSNSVLKADLTDKWIDLLLKNHGFEYAKKALGYHNKKMDAIDKYVENEVEEFRKKTKKSVASEYDKLAILYLKADAIIRAEQERRAWKDDEPTMD